MEDADAGPPPRAAGTHLAANVQAMKALHEYRRRRDFARSPEPRGRAARRRGDAGGRFVVQKHAARSLHYDFRLELDGVLKSWAVPKGPSLVPGERRLAAQTEDHPLEYAEFEGVIPPDEYGGGEVVVWDRGEWQPIGDARAGLEQGELTFRLAGRKLRGRWHLVRMRPRARKRGGAGRASWLLIKGRDGDAQAAGAEPITAAAPRSVLTGRDVQELAAEGGRAKSSTRVRVGTRTRAAQRVRSARAPASAPPPALRTEVAGVRLSTPERIYFPELGITKSELASYYERMAERVLPGLVDRPLTLLRCPEGREGECFYQKRADRSIPERVPRVVVKAGRAPYALVRDLASLVALVQVGVLELHVWGARADRLDRPDVAIVDLDPDPELPWRSVAEAARLLRVLFEELGLVPFVRSTGGKGLHLVVPLVRRASWAEVKSLAQGAAQQLVRSAPERFTDEMSKAKRRGKIFLDVFRNGPEATTIASWSVRARPGAPVAAPLAWDEVDADQRPLVSLRDAPARLSQPDPWAGFEEARRALTLAMRRRVGAG